jgi:predicted Zn-dependent peptidase
VKSRMLIIAAIIAAMIAPMAALASDGVTSGNLPHGGRFLLYPDTTIPSASIDLWFRAPSAGYDNASPGLSRLAATSAAAATLASGQSLVTLVRSLGGRIAINVYPDIVGISTEVPSNVARRVVAAMSAAYFAPSIDENALKTAQRDVAVLSVQRRFSPDDLLHDALFARIFDAGPGHDAPIPGSLQAVTAVTLAQVRAFAQNAFRSANATMTLTGNVAPALVGAVTDGKPGRPDRPFDSTVVKKAPPAVSEIGAVSGDGIAWIGPGIDNERAATAMDFVADYLFRDGTGVVSKELGSSGDTYVNGQFITLNNPGIMLVTIGGSKAAVAQARVLSAVQKMSQPLEPATFAAALNAFLYHLAYDTQTPGEQADNLGWYAAEGNATYAPSDTHSQYWSVARGLDPAFVASVVRQYLAHPVVVHLTASSKEPAS